MPETGDRRAEAFGPCRVLLMPYFPVDDQASFHPKIVAAGNAAVGLWTRAGAWSKNHATGGFVPEQIARSMGTKGEIKKLVEVALWDDVLGGYFFHDWEHYGANRSGAEEEEARASRRAADRERQRRHRDKNRDSHSVTNGVTNADVTAPVTAPVSRARSRALAQGPSPVPDLGDVEEISPVPETGREPGPDQVSPDVHYIDAGIRQKVDFRKIKACVIEQAPEVSVSDAIVWGITETILQRAKRREGDRTGVVLTSLKRDWAEWSQFIYRQDSA